VELGDEQRQRTASSMSLMDKQKSRANNIAERADLVSKHKMKNMEEEERHHATGQSLEIRSLSHAPSDRPSEASCGPMIMNGKERESADFSGASRSMTAKKINESEWPSSRFS